MKEPVFKTPWFQVRSETPSEGGAPHYIIDSPDYAVIVARDERGRLLLVRQYRVAMQATTLEVPAGQIETGETPEQTARKELLEETGYEAPNFEFLGKLAPSTARFSNRMWVFWAENAHPAPDATAQMEPGMHLVIHDQGWRALIAHPQFYAGPSCAALFLALARSKLT